MADNTIDRLQIEISANAASANNSIGKLAESMIKLSGSVNGINVGKFHDLASGLNQFSNAMLRFTAGTKAQDFTRIVTGLNKLSNVNIQGVSDTSRAISILSANLNELGRISFDSQGIATIANSISLLGRKTVTQASENIPLLTTSLRGLVEGLNKVGTVSFDLTKLSELTASISKLGSKTATVAAEKNIKNLSISLKEMMTTLSTAPKVSQNLISMTNALSQLASAGGRAGTAARSMGTSFNIFSASTKKAKKASNGLATAFGKFYATYWLLIRGLGLFRNAIDISSDLTEVQNVVDVTFGDMAYKVQDFAESSIESFGMSELALKRYASRFQAMGSAMGIDTSLIQDANKYLSNQTDGYIKASGSMADMSLNLTKLTADMASFYNVEQAVVAEDLESIFTGQTRPLRQYGLDLTQTTLAEWAMKNGLDANVQAMTQAEKTMLRYQYVLANTGAAQNDFSRTSGTWANQVRILAQSFEQLGAVIGGTLINAFKPLVTALNSVMQKVIAFTKTIADALGTIFGWTIEVSVGGLAQDFGTAASGSRDLAGGTGKAADNTGKAAKNAKELNKYMADWQEVNNMTSDESGSGGGGGAGGGGGGGGAGDGIADALNTQLVKTETIFDKFESEIDTLYKLGEYIGDALTSTLNDIDWDKVYEGAKNFGTGLAQFLNGLISPELFGAVGTTIAGSLNAAIYAALAFGKEFDWTDFGLSIATGVNAFFSTFDFASLAATLNTWANGLLDALIDATENIDWGKIGTQIGIYFENLDWGTILLKTGKLIVKALSGAFKAYVKLFEVSPLEGVIIAGVAGFKFKGLRKAVASALKTALGSSFALSLPNISLSLPNINFALGGGLGVGFVAIVDEIVWKIEEGIKEVFGERILNAMGESLLIAESAGIGFAVGNIPGMIVGAIIGGIINLIQGGEWTTTFWTNFINTLFNFDFTESLLNAANEFFNTAFTTDSFLEFGTNIVLGILAGIEAALSFVTEPLFDLFNAITSGICSIFGISSPAKKMNPYGAYILEGIIEGFKNTFNEWTKALNEWFNKYISPWFTSRKWSELYNTIKTSLKSKWDETVSQWSIGISSWWNNQVAPWFTVEKWSSIAIGIKNGIKSKWDETVVQWNTDISSWWTNNVSSWFTVEKWQNVSSGIKTGLSNSFSAAVEGIKGIWNSFASWLNSKLSFDIPPINIMGKTVYGGGSVQLGKLPTFAQGGIVDGARLAIVGEAGKEAIMPLERNTGWIRNLASNIDSMIGNREINIMPNLTKYDFVPSIPNNKFNNNFTDPFDENMARYIFEIQRQNELLEEQNEILDRIYDKTGITESDIFDANRRQTKQFISRTGKMPYPVV